VLTLSLDTLVEVVDGKLVHGSASTVVNGLALDSREVTPGAAFVAFSGTRVDGRSFVGQALKAGARAVLVTEADEQVIEVVRGSRRHDVAVVEIGDPGAAVRDLASYHRSRLNCAVVGITGSTGKTSTKDLVTAALGSRLKVVATSGNRNNELGVPLTVMEASADTEVLIVEMAMRGRGEITALCGIARPTIGLVTNVGETHMERLGSQEAIASAKGELVESIASSGVVFLNGDDVWSERLRESASARVVMYGLGKGNDVRATDLEIGPEGHVRFTLISEYGSRQVCLPVPGKHNAYNAAAALAVALECGVELDDAVEGVEGARLSPMRMEVFSSASGVMVINDAYNASPTSMRAGLDALMDIPVPGRRVAVLGDMAELGSLTELAHFELGKLVAFRAIDELVTVGDKAARIAEGAHAAGMSKDRIITYQVGEDAARYVADTVVAGDAVLVKASRVMGLECVVERIVQPDVQP